MEARIKQGRKQMKCKRKTTSKQGETTNEKKRIV
jgi:hypothetical protein